MTAPVPPLTPYLTVSDAVAAIDFYQKAFNATLDGEPHIMPGTSKIMHARLLVNGSLLMLADDFSDAWGTPSMAPNVLGGSPIVLALNLADVQSFWNRAVAAGVTVTMPLADMFWGDRYGQFTDPFGHRWSCSQTLAVMTGEQMRQAADAAMKEHGTLMGDTASAA
jgi:PhnB protein